MNDYIVTKDWSDPIFVEDCDKPKCKEVKKCKKVEKKCKKVEKKCKEYKPIGVVDDMYKYRHKYDEYHCHKDKHDHHGKKKHCKPHKEKAPCMPQSKVFINTDCASNGEPRSIPFRFRLPLPLAEYCGPQHGYDFDGFIKTYINFRGQVDLNEFVEGLPAGSVAWLVVDVIDDTRCGKEKLIHRVAVQAPLPTYDEETDTWIDADPFDFTFDGGKKCVDYRDHILFRSQFVITDGLRPNLKARLNAAPLTADFVETVDPTFEITAFPCFPGGKKRHHHDNKCGGCGHGGYHGGHCNSCGWKKNRGGCFKGIDGCHRGNKCYDKRCY